MEEAEIPKVYTAYNLDELDEYLQDPEWVVEGLIPKDEPTFIYGDGGQGKSAVVLNICMNVQEGMPVSGLPSQKMRVLWLALEGDRDIKKRRKAHQSLYGKSEVTEFFVIPKQTFTFGNQQDETALSELITENNIELVVIDTLSYATDGDISTGNTPGIVTRQMRRMCDTLKISLIVVAHTGKNLFKGIKGASEFANNVPCVLFINKGVLEVQKQRSSISGKKLKFDKKIIDDSFCIEWKEESNPRLAHILDSLDILTAKQDVVSKKDLSNLVYERYEKTLSRDHHRTNFNRDLKTLSETQNLLNVSSESIKRNSP